MSIEAMKQALEALEQLQGGCTDSDDGTVEAITVWCPEVITTLRAAIEQAEKHEPVAWMYVNTDGECEQIEYIKNEPMPDDPSITPLYTAPRQWQGLTDEEIAELHHEIKVRLIGTYKTEDIYRAIEAKLKEKNT